MASFGTFAEPSRPVAHDLTSDRRPTQIPESATRTIFWIF
jgi:hypothetical protein